jgi:hypothetical protein
LINNISTPLSNHTSFFVYWLVQCLTNIQSKEPLAKSRSEVQVSVKPQPNTKTKEKSLTTKKKSLKRQQQQEQVHRSTTIDPECNKDPSVRYIDQHKKTSSNRDKNNTGTTGVNEAPGEEERPTNDAVINNIYTTSGKQE